MIARREWSSLPVRSSINLEGNKASIIVDAEALERILRMLQRSIEPAVQACQYDKAMELIACYRDIEELLMALLSENKEEQNNDVLPENNSTGQE